MSIEIHLERQKRINTIIGWVEADDTIGQDVLAIVMAGMRRDKEAWRQQAMEMETIAVWADAAPKLRGRGAPAQKERWAKGKIEKLLRFRHRLFFNWDELIGKKEASHERD